MSTSLGYMLDTNVLVHLLRGKDLGQAIDRRYGLTSTLSRSVISVVTVGEMLSLASKFCWGKPKRAALQEMLEDIVWIDINRIDILEAYGKIDSYSQSHGKKMGKNDVWIAATASVSKTTLLTTDKDFDHLVPTYLQLNRIDPKT